MAITEKEKQDIKKEAKAIMERFGRALEKVEKETSDSEVEREHDRREERKDKETDSEFRKIMFENAPKKSGDCIVAEKGAWV